MKGRTFVLYTIVFITLIGNLLVVTPLLQPTSHNVNAKFSVAQIDVPENLFTQSLGSYLGGNGDEERGFVTVDLENNIVIAFTSKSTDILTTDGAFQSDSHEQSDCFIAKISSAGQMIFGTYLGGDGTDQVHGLAVNDDGSIMVTGSTTSSDFPVSSNAWQTEHGGDTDGFIAILDETGSNLLGCTFLGETNDDAIWGAALDSAGKPVVTGRTESTNLATSEANQTYNVGSYDAFIAKFNSDCTDIEFFSYLGGATEDRGYIIRLDDADNIVVCGYTISTDFPLVDATQETFQGIEDLFISEFDATGQNLLFSTLMGGNEQDNPRDMVLDTDGNPIVVGRTRSTDLSVVNAIQEEYGGSQDAFVVKYDIASHEIAFCTYWGGSVYENIGGVSLDHLGRIYLFGDTSSLDFVVTTGEDVVLGGSRDCFFSILNTDGQSLNCSFLFGGEDVEYAGMMAIDSNSDVILVGNSKSSEFPIMNPIQDNKAEGYDGFFCKMTTAPSSSTQLDAMFFIAIVGIVAVVIIVALVWRKR